MIGFAAWLVAAPIAKAQMPAVVRQVELDPLTAAASLATSRPAERAIVDRQGQAYYCNFENPEKSLRIALHKASRENNAFKGKDSSGIYRNSGFSIFERSVRREQAELAIASGLAAADPAFGGNAQGDRVGNDAQAASSEGDGSDFIAAAAVFLLGYPSDDGVAAMRHAEWAAQRAAYAAATYTAELLINEDWTTNKACIVWAFPDRQPIAYEIALDPDLPRRVRFGLGVAAGELGKGDASVVPDPASDALERFSADLLPGELDLARVGRLFIRPGGVTSQLPFLALKYQNQRLGARFAVVVLSSIEDSHGSVKLIDPKALVIGDPLLRWDNRTRRTAISYSKIEAQGVARAFKTQALLGAEATLESVMGQMRKANYIHFASHAVSDPENPMDGSYVVLSNGYLTGRDIQHSGRLSVSVVVLSGCQTGLGKPFVGGTYGLARAFLANGAGQVVGNLWNVNDAISGRLMERFAQHVAAGQGAEYALQAVVREALDIYPDTPSYWGSFVLYGRRSDYCANCHPTGPDVLKKPLSAFIAARLFGKLSQPAP